MESRIINLFEQIVEHSKNTTNLNAFIVQYLTNVNTSTHRQNVHATNNRFANRRNTTLVKRVPCTKQNKNE